MFFNGFLYHPLFRPLFSAPSWPHFFHFFHFFHFRHPTFFTSRIPPIISYPTFFSLTAVCPQYPQISLTPYFFQFGHYPLSIPPKYIVLHLKPLYILYILYIIWIYKYIYSLYILYMKIWCLYSICIMSISCIPFDYKFSSCIDFAFLTLIRPL